MGNWLLSNICRTRLRKILWAFLFFVACTLKICIIEGGNRIGFEFSDQILGFHIQITEIKYIEFGFGSDLNYFGSKSIPIWTIDMPKLRMQNEISGETHWMQNINYPFEYQYFRQNKILHN